ncbi:MAG TPA: DUF433 domain-containing protein [Pyrinomonadaceae bacterium]|nr:DUF433 domain-containing protein [Pyrinomonadaceae bacterium]
MIDQTLLGRISANPDIFGGKPIIRGMRISVELVLSLLAQGETPEAILADYPDLEPDDLRACLAYAHAVIANDQLDSVQVVG